MEPNTSAIYSYKRRDQCTLWVAAQGRIQGGGVLGVRNHPTPPFGGPPNFIKREKTSHVCAKTPHFSTEQLPPTHFRNPVSAPLSLEGSKDQQSFKIPESTASPIEKALWHVGSCFLYPVVMHHNLAG